jgi:uncharacterized protein YlxW (UPF0749 family)
VTDDYGRSNRDPYLIHLQYIRRSIDELNAKVDKYDKRLSDVEDKANKVDGGLAATQLYLKIIGMVGTMGSFIYVLWNGAP